MATRSIGDGVWRGARRLTLGVLLIVLVSGLLLVSDLDRRTGAAGISNATSVRQIGVLQYSSTPPLEDGARGFVDGLGELGFRDGGGRVALTWYKAEADMGVANAIARQLTSGQFDLIVTLGTPALQAVANANRAGRVPHIFGVVAAPQTAGVGIGDKGPLDHPRHLIGVGTYISPGDSFRMARRMFPGLKSVGIVWNSAESNSRVFTEAARGVCRELGITVLEANVDNSNGVAESAASLVARGADALWLGGDNTVMTASASLVAAGKGGRVPVFTIIPGNTEKGSLFDYGANLYKNGKAMASLAAKVIEGTDPAVLPVENLVVSRVMINMLALRDLKDPWRVTPDMLRQAETVIDEAGTHNRAPGPNGR